MALLLLAFLSIPFAWEMRIRWLLLGGGILLPVVAACIMWQEGIHNLRQAGKPADGYLHVMRQSGFFDLVVGMMILALVLGILWGIGLISYNATFHAHAVLAAGDGPVPATLEEARLLPDFVEYNFKQDLNLLAQSYGAFGTLALILVVVAFVCLLYMRFVSPIVRAIMLFPIYWMIISSFKTSTELLSPVPTLWPQEFIWQNYPNVLNRAPFLRYLVNTLVTTLCIMAGELTIGVMAAYGFSKGEFKGKNVLFMLVLGALMVPIQVTFVPIYVLIARLNSIDTYLGIILPNLISAYFIFMLRQNFMAVDNSYIEAGRVDGMGRIGTIFHVLCPMCKPTLITVSIISFINGWNSYFWPKMVTKTEASRTIAVGVQQLKNTFAGQEVSNYNEIMAGAVMAIIPIVLLFLVLQKYIMTGMSKAAMK